MTHEFVTTKHNGQQHTAWRAGWYMCMAAPHTDQHDTECHDIMPHKFSTTYEFKTRSLYHKIAISISNLQLLLQHPIYY